MIKGWRLNPAWVALRKSDEQRRHDAQMKMIDAQMQMQIRTIEDNVRSKFYAHEVTHNGLPILASHELDAGLELYVEVVLLGSGERAIRFTDCAHTGPIIHKSMFVDAKDWLELKCAV